MMILAGIMSVTRKKRITVKIYDDLSEIPEKERVVILICASLKWATDTIAKLNRKGIHPLLCGFQYIDTMFQYSCITLTYTKTMYQLTSQLLMQDKSPVAFLGYNPDSFPDKLKLKGVQYAAMEYGVPLKIYDNHGDIEQCLENFKADCDGIKNIVCSNGCVSTIFVARYPELLKDRNLCSCLQVKASEYQNATYLTSTVNYIKVGEQLAELYIFLNNCNRIYSVTMTLDMDISWSNGIQAVQVPMSKLLYSNETVDFYGDKEISEVENLNKMLLKCDCQDMEILHDLLLDYSYETIAENRYYALNTVRYRVRLIMKNANVSSKKELLELIKKYKLQF